MKKTGYACRMFHVRITESLQNATKDEKQLVS
jgi:hypothetical protein